MKKPILISIIGILALLVSSAATPAFAAQASFVSGDGEAWSSMTLAPYGGVTYVLSGSNANPKYWAAPISGSKWVSYGNTGKDGNGPRAGAVFSITENVQLTGTPTGGTIKVMADDLLTIKVNNVVVLDHTNEGSPYFTAQHTVTVPASALRSGYNFIEFIVSQGAHNAYTPVGVDYVGTFTSDVSGGTFACNDGQDNDGDYQIDSNDRGCHSDDNVTNPNSYVPTDNDESNVVTQPTNHAPTCQAIPSRTVTAGTLTTFRLSASDVDADAITVAPMGTLAGLTFIALPTPVNQIIRDYSWTPTAAQVGVWPIHFSISDGRSGGTIACDTTITVTAAPAPANRAPTCPAISNKTATVGQALTFTYTATDPDADGMTVTPIGFPTGATFISVPQVPGTATNSFSWTPSNDQAGVYYNPTVRVTDSRGLSCQTSFYINVSQVPVPPSPTVYECNDGIDNDGDGKVDFNGINADPGCSSATDNNEYNRPRSGGGNGNNGGTSGGNGQGDTGNRIVNRNTNTNTSISNNTSNNINNISITNTGRR